MSVPACADVETPSESGDDSSVNLYSGSWLYSSDAGSTPLFEGSSSTVLTALVKQFHWFTEHPGISKEALSSQFAMQHAMLPKGNNLPCSYDAALAKIEPYLVQPTVYDVCENDCILYRNEYSEHLECTECHSARYISKETNTPKRRFIYLPLQPRLRRFFGTSNLAAVLQSHTILQSGKIYDIQQSSVWQEAYSESGLFQGDPRGVSLSLCILMA